MSFFYRFVAAAMDLNNFESPTAGMATPYTAFFIFAIGIFLSNFLFNTLVMKRPFVGLPSLTRNTLPEKQVHTWSEFSEDASGD